MRRNWIKLYVDQCLRGTMVSELSAPERWIWVGLLLMAGDSNVDGKIYLRKDEDRNLVGYSDNTIAELLAVDVKTFQIAVKKLIKYEKINVNKHKVITIINWKKYQSEYERQKVYRESYKKNNNSKCNGSNAPEREKERERERELEKEKAEKPLDVEFEEFWKFYYKMGNKYDDPGDKNAAKKAYNILKATVSKAKIVKALNGYSGYLKHKKLKEGFCQRKMYASTFLRSKRWERFLDFKYKPSL